MTVGPTVAALHGLAARAGAGHQVVVLAIGVTNASELTITRGRYAVDAVVRALADRVHASGIHAEPVRISAHGLIAALTAADHDADDAAHRLAREIGGLVDVGGERLWPTLTVTARRCTVGESTATTLRQVCAALAEAMRAAPGSVQWAVDRDADDAQDRMTLVRDLAIALHDDTAQIALAYQPVRDLHSHAQVGAEALVRWTHPVLGPVSAATMVGVAEDHGLVSRLGRLVLDRSLEATAAAGTELAPDFRLHVNVSPHELREPGYADGVLDALARHRIHPSTLLLEMTENALMTSATDVLPVVATLRASGVKIGIDDFGTGYSSIGRLQQMPIDTVKIDQSLIAEIATSPQQFDLVRAVLRMVGTTDARVVAEGVETAVQVAHLRALGCTLGQGHFLGAPAPWSTISRAS